MDILIIFLFKIVTIMANQKSTQRLTADEEKLHDPDGFAAISELHKIMDDDKSGSIDRFESTDFLKEDLKIGGIDRVKREKVFHNNNETITVDDLWESWLESVERTWDEQKMIEWLCNVVQLPQYSSYFSKAQISGIDLPRIATQNSSFIANVIGIKNFIHRQKLQLKALDVVLFGLQNKSTIIKDIVLAALIILLVGVLVLFKTYQSQSTRQMAELSSALSELKHMEKDFVGVQQKLNENQVCNQPMYESEHIEALKSQLIEAEKRIEMNGFDVSVTLQPLLRRTYEIETSYINAQKIECLREMREAKEYINKMRRKQTGLVTSFKITTGMTFATDIIDNKIFSLKSRIENIKLTMEECQQRWIEIESICGFSIIESYVFFNSSLSTNNISSAGTSETGLMRKSNLETDSQYFQDNFFDSESIGTNGNENVIDNNGNINNQVQKKNYARHAHGYSQSQVLKLAAQKTLTHKLTDQIAQKELIGLKNINGDMLENQTKALLLLSNREKSNDDDLSVTSSKANLSNSSNVKKRNFFNQLFRRKETKN